VRGNDECFILGDTHSDPQSELDTHRSSGSCYSCGQKGRHVGVMAALVGQKVGMLG
jgi:hypothetical protein